MPAVTPPTMLSLSPDVLGGHGEELGCLGASALVFAYLGSCRVCCVMEQPVSVSPPESCPWGHHRSGARVASQPPS